MESFIRTVTTLTLVLTLSTDRVINEDTVQGNSTLVQDFKLNDKYDNNVDRITYVLQEGSKASPLLPQKLHTSSRVHLNNILYVPLPDSQQPLTKKSSSVKHQTLNSQLTEGIRRNKPKYKKIHSRNNKGKPGVQLFKIGNAYSDTDSKVVVVNQRPKATEKANTEDNSWLLDTDRPLRKLGVDPQAPIFVLSNETINYFNTKEMIELMVEKDYNMARKAAVLNTLKHDMSKAKADRISPTEDNATTGEDGSMILKFFGKVLPVNGTGLLGNQVAQMTDISI